MVSEKKGSHQDPILSHTTFKPYSSVSAGQEKEKNATSNEEHSYYGPNRVLKAAGFGDNGNMQLFTTC